MFHLLKTRFSFDKEPLHSNQPWITILFLPPPQKGLLLNLARHHLFLALERHLHCTAGDAKLQGAKTSKKNQKDYDKQRYAKKDLY